MEGDPGKDSWKSRKEWWMGVEREKRRCGRRKKEALCMERMEMFVISQTGDAVQCRQIRW